MNAIISKVQTDLGKLQKTIEKEGEVLLGKIKDAASKAASNEKVVEKRKQIEQLVQTQYKKYEPKIDKLYKDLKGTAEKYGVDVEKIEKGVKSTTQSAVSRLNLERLSANRKGKKAQKGAAGSKKKQTQNQATKGLGKKA